MGAPQGFAYTPRGEDIIITHGRRQATTLRGAAAQRFLVDVEQSDPQQLMARVTGAYRHGNERTAKNHPRNRGR